MRNIITKLIYTSLTIIILAVLLVFVIKPSMKAKSASIDDKEKIKVENNSITQNSPNASEGLITSINDKTFVLTTKTDNYLINFENDDQSITKEHLQEHLDKKWLVKVFWKLDGDVKKASRIDDAGY